MARGMRIIRLEEDARTGVVRFLADRINLAEGKRSVTVNVTRVGKFSDPRYGDFEITREMLLSMVKNFEANIYGQEIALDVAHMPQNGAAGYFRKLFLDGTKLRGEVELTDYGIEAITKRGYRYLSAEYFENFTDNEKKLAHGPTLVGAALTVRPVIKRLDPVQLSEDSLGAGPTLVSDRIKTLLLEEQTNMTEFLKKLRDKLAAMKLAEGLIKQLCEAFETAAKPLGDEKLQLALMEHFTVAGSELAKSLAAGNGDQTIKLDFSGLQEALKTGAKTLTEDDIKRVLAQADVEKAEKTRKLAESRDGKVKLFTDALDKAEGLKNLSETTRTELGKAAELITADMSDAQVTKLAEHQISLGNQIAVQARLAGMGFSPAGSANISISETNSIKSLQETVDRRLGILDLSEAQRFANTGGKLLEVNKKLAEKVLAEFDVRHGAQLHAEHKMLAAGDGKVSDVAVPAIYERTVIREALYGLIGLQFVDSGTLPFASSALIPYSYRDTTAGGRGDTRTYEGGAIKRAGVIQTSETAYPIPQKIAFEVSDELRYLTATGILDWDSVIESSRNASRIIGEDTEGMIFNEVLRASDEFAVTAVANEATATADGTKRIFVTDNFPVLRPRKLFDLQGNQIGNTLYPIVISMAGTVRNEYDGTGTQAAGTYYVLDYNLGEVQFVTELGAPVTPANTNLVVCSYSYTTNAYKFDTDLGTDKDDEHWDKFLYRFGLRKAVIEQDRYYQANFGLMSGTVRAQVEQARQFAANYARSGTDLSSDGNLGRIKDVAQFRTTAPGLYMGDTRIVVGQRGVTRFRMMKPWAMGQLENQKDANGRFTGKKEAYGDQFLVLHTPTKLKGAYTSIQLYSSAGRVDRAS